jgi:hypothetical protein
MNVDVWMRWGNDMLCVLDAPGRWPDNALDHEVWQEQWGWGRECRRPLQEWGELRQVLARGEHVGRTRGVDRGVHRAVKALLTPVVRLPRGKRVSTELVAFLAEESWQARPHERLVGSREVIESVFGKLQRLEHDQAKGGFTGLVWSSAAMVSTTTGEVIQKALQTVPTKRVLAWCKETLGQSVQSKRRKAFARPKETEQKRDQFKAAG